MTTTCNYFGYNKKPKEETSIKDFIEPTKRYSEEVLEISNDIAKETDQIAREIKAFKDAFQEIKEKHNDGMSMEQIRDSYVIEQQQQEVNDIEDEILDLFSKKLKSLKQNLKA